MFVQIMEGRTSDPAALRAQGAAWQKDLGPGAVGFLGVTGGITDDGRTISIVRFDAESAARRNSERPEQSAWWEQMSKLFDGEVSFTESSDVTEWMGGGSNDAGFVQVMKSTGVDRAAVERMDKAFEPHAGLRPDLLGGLRVWTGPDSCIDTAYFISERSAREGEQAEMPDELKELMEGMGDALGTTEYLDLTDPQLY
jgi:hypothetical protein